MLLNKVEDEIEKHRESRTQEKDVSLWLNGKNYKKTFHRRKLGISQEKDINYATGVKKCGLSMQRRSIISFYVRL